MGFFQPKSDIFFKKNKQDQTLFYPWGLFGRARIILNADTEQHLREHSKPNWLVLIASYLIYKIFIWWLGIGLLVVYGFWNLAQRQSILKDCPYSDEKVSYAELTSKQKVRYSIPFSCFVLLLCAAFTALGVWIITTSNTTKDFWTGIEVTACFGVLFILFAYSLKLRISSST